jgi:hypothetical protein
MTHSFADNTYVLPLNEEDAVANNAYFPASGSFVDVTGYARFAYILSAGAIDNADTFLFTVYQDKSATATASIAVITGALHSFAGTDDDTQAVIEVETAKLTLDSTFRYVTIRATGVTGSDYCAITFLGLQPRSAPVSQESSMSLVEIAG